jgi:hypothetical protein
LGLVQSLMRALMNVTFFQLVSSHSKLWRGGLLF